MSAKLIKVVRDEAEENTVARNATTRNAEIYLDFLKSHRSLLHGAKKLRHHDALSEAELQQWITLEQSVNRSAQNWEAAFNEGYPFGFVASDSSLLHPLLGADLRNPRSRVGFIEFNPTGHANEEVFAIYDPVFPAPSDALRSAFYLSWYEKDDQWSRIIAAIAGWAMLHIRWRDRPYRRKEDLQYQISLVANDHQLLPPPPVGRKYVARTRAEVKDYRRIIAIECGREMRNWCELFIRQVSRALDGERPRKSERRTSPSADIYDADDEFDKFCESERLRGYSINGRRDDFDEYTSIIETLAECEAKVNPDDAPMLGLLAQGHKPAGIAKKMGLSPKGRKNMIERIRYQLRDEAKELTEDEPSEQSPIINKNFKFFPKFLTSQCLEHWEVFLCQHFLHFIEATRFGKPESLG